MPVVVALARLYQGAHHPTDELASVFYAGTWLAVVGSVVLGERGAGRAPPGPTDR